MTSKKKILIIPGMNQSREVFLPLLNSTFFDAEILEFPSNLSDRVLFKQTSLLDYKSILKLKLEKNKYDHIYAHSLGGLILCELVCVEDTVLEDVGKVTLLGCALKGRYFSFLVEFLPDFFKIPSFNSKKFRVHSFCYAFMYKEIIRLQKNIDIKILKNHSKLNFYFDPRDELLDVEVFNDFQNAYEYFSKDIPRHLYYDFIEKVAAGHLF